MNTAGERQSRPEAAHVVRHTLLGGVQQAVSIGVGLLILPYMLARLGTERYGLLLMAQIFSMAGVLAYADVGMHNAVIRFLAGHHARGEAAAFRRVLATSFMTFFGIGALCALFVVLFTELAFFRVFDVPAEYRQEVRWSLYVYGAAFMLHFPLFVLKAFYAGVQDLVRLRLWEIMERATYGVTIAILLLSSQSIFHVALAEQAVAGLGFVLFVAVAAVRHGRLFSLRAGEGSWAVLREIWPLSAQVFLNRMSHIVFQKAPELLIAGFLGPTQMAYYGIVQKIPRALKVLGSAVNGAVFPFAAALDALDLQRQLGRLVLRGARYCYLLLTPVVAFIVVFAEDILRVWVGAQYAFLGNLLRAFVLWQYAMFLHFFLAATFTRPEQYAKLLRYGIAGNVVFLLVAWGEIRRFGLWAVAAGLLAGAVITVTGILRVQRDSIQIALRDFYRLVLKLPVVWAGLASGLALAGVRAFVAPWGVGPLAAALVAAGLLYAAGVYRFGLGPLERADLARGLQRVVKA